MINQAFAVLLDLESARERAKLAPSEQEARIARMTERGLIDQEGFRDQEAARPQSARKLREQRAVEKVYVHDNVERFVLEMKVIQVCDHGPDGQSLGLCIRSKKAHRLDGKIDGDHAHVRSRERECVAPATRGDVEHDAARNSREHREQERLGFAGRLAAMTLIPAGVFRFAHSTRASVKTSTDAAPAAISTRAHSSTVAPVVITSSTISTRRLLMRSGYETVNARRTFLIRSS